MWTDLVEAVLAVLAFVSFPFLVISTAAAVLMLLDRIAHIHNHNHHHHRL